MRSCLLLSAALACAVSGDALAQRVYRCLSAEGVAMYVDRPCARLGVAERPDPAASEVPTDATGEAEPLQPELTLGCPATQGSELVERLRAAVASRDANAVAALYLWSGLGRHDAEAAFPRFDALIEAGIDGIVQVHEAPRLPASDAAAPPAAATDADLVLAAASAAPPGQAGVGSDQDAAGQPLVEPEGMAEPGTATAPVLGGEHPAAADGWQAAHPVALRVQLAGGGLTVFEVRRQAGCLWLRYPLRSVQELPSAD